MKFILDTHIVAWYLMAGNKLTKGHRKVIESAERRKLRIGVSVASLWELAKLHQYGRIRAPGGLAEFIHYIEAHPCFEVLGLTGDIAIESTKLGDSFPRDPFDQIIVATARVRALSLLTVDQRVIASGAVSCV